MRKKTTVSVITLNSVKNYGSVLQTFATQSILQNAGFDVSIVNYIKPGSSDRDLTKTWIKNSDKNPFIVGIVLQPTIIRWKHVFGNFTKKYLKLSRYKYETEEDFRIHPVRTDAYCVGSDQVWNSSWNHGIVGPFYLSYAPDNSFKFSFSSSIGKSEFEDWEKNDTRQLLRSFNRISVREDNAVRLLDEIGVHDSVHIIDPTLLETATFWNQLSETVTPIEEDYLLIYQLNSSHKFDEYAEKVSKQMGLKLVRLCTRYDQALKPGKAVLVPSVEQFVCLFQNAKLVLTDSFHGTAFSVNFNTPFISIYPDHFSSRIDSLLRLTGLEHQKLSKFSDYDLPEEKIDFTTANTFLADQRQKADDFLESVKSDLARVSD